MEINFLSAAEYLPRFQMGAVQPDRDDIILMLETIIDSDNSQATAEIEAENLKTDLEEAEKTIEELEAKFKRVLKDLEDAEAEIKSLKSARPRMIRPVFKRLSRPKKRLTQSIDYDFSLEQNNNLLACFV